MYQHLLVMLWYFRPFRRHDAKPHDLCLSFQFVFTLFCFLLIENVSFWCLETENCPFLLPFWQRLCSLCLSPRISRPLFFNLPILNVLVPPQSLRLCQWSVPGGRCRLFWGGVVGVEVMTSFCPALSRRFLVSLGLSLAFPSVCVPHFLSWQYLFILQQRQLSRPFIATLPRHRQLYCHTMNRRAVFLISDWVQGRKRTKWPWRFWKFEREGVAYLKPLE